MADFIEIDFLEAGERGSGDAIAIRQSENGFHYIHVVDGGYAADGQRLVDHVRQNYGPHYFINHLVLTHPDGDHASGLETVLRQMRVEYLWMNRPWNHVDRLMPMFERYQDRGRLVSRLKSDFDHVATLEAVALDRNVEIRDAFEGNTIGPFTVLSPSLPFFLRLVVESDRTPVPAADLTAWMALYRESAPRIAWGEEDLKGDAPGTTPDNEMSIVQFAHVCGKRILLTGDAGVRALAQARRAAFQRGLQTGPLDWFQVPHHGSRRNLSSDVLDAWLGASFLAPVPALPYEAIVSANTRDLEHPKHAVVRALMHRGRSVLQTRGTLWMPSAAAPHRAWPQAIPLPYPDFQEE